MDPKDKRETAVIDEQCVPSRAGGQEEFLRGVEKVAGLGASQIDDAPLARRIQALRQAGGLDLADVSQRTGLSEGELTAIEEGRLSPPLGVLMKLAKALGSEMGTLIAGGAQAAHAVVRASQRQPISRRAGDADTSYGYSYEHLAAAKANRAMEPFVVTLHPHAEAKPASQHDGQEFIFVLEGRMEAVVGEVREVLDPGDSIYYDSGAPHYVRALGDQPARILAVLTSK